MEPYTSIKWSQAYSLVKGIDVGSTANSYLCSNYAWDTAINFIQNNTMWTNYATSTDGMNENWKNIEVVDNHNRIIKVELITIILQVLQQDFDGILTQVVIVLTMVSEPLYS